MKTMVRVDKWNSNKYWILKESSCGHYYIGQRVGCLYFPPKRCRKFHYMEVLESSSPLPDVEEELTQLAVILEWWIPHVEDWGHSVTQFIKKGIQEQANTVADQLDGMSPNDIYSKLYDLSEHFNSIVYWNAISWLEKAVYARQEVGTTTPFSAKWDLAKRWFQDNEDALSKL